MIRQVIRKVKRKKKRAMIASIVWSQDRSRWFLIVDTPNRLDEYRRFLVAGQLIGERPVYPSPEQVHRLAEQYVFNESYHYVVYREEQVRPHTVPPIRNWPTKFQQRTEAVPHPAMDERWFGG